MRRGAWRAADARKEKGKRHQPGGRGGGVAGARAVVSVCVLERVEGCGDRCAALPPPPLPRPLGLASPIPRSSFSFLHCCVYRSTSPPLSPPCAPPSTGASFHVPLSPPSQMELLSPTSAVRPTPPAALRTLSPSSFFAPPALPSCHAPVSASPPPGRGGAGRGGAGELEGGGLVLYPLLPFRVCACSFSRAFFLVSSCYCFVGCFPRRTFHLRVVAAP